MGATEDESPPKPRLTYRERDVDETLDDHDKRISRLEKALLIGVGYAFASQDMLVQAVLSLIL